MNDNIETPGAIYFLAFAAACTGVAFMCMGLWSALAPVLGGDEADGIDRGGGVGLAIAFVLVYAERATRWQKLSDGQRLLARLSITATLVISAFCTAACLYLAFAHANELRLSMIFGPIAALCQIGTFYWVNVARPQAFATSK